MRVAAFCGIAACVRRCARQFAVPGGVAALAAERGANKHQFTGVFFFPSHPERDEPALGRARPGHSGLQRRFGVDLPLPVALRGTRCALGRPRRGRQGRIEKSLEGALVLIAALCGDASLAAGREGDARGGFAALCGGAPLAAGREGGARGDLQRRAATLCSPRGVRATHAGICSAGRRRFARRTRWSEQAANPNLWIFPSRSEGAGQRSVERVRDAAVCSGVPVGVAAAGCFAGDALRAGPSPPGTARKD